MGVGKYSPTVEKAYDRDRDWRKKIMSDDGYHDVDGYDEYGYNEDGKDRAGYSESDYISTYHSYENEFCGTEFDYYLYDDVRRDWYYGKDGKPHSYSLDQYMALAKEVNISPAVIQDLVTAFKGDVADATVALKFMHENAERIFPKVYVVEEIIDHEGFQNIYHTLKRPQAEGSLAFMQGKEKRKKDKENFEINEYNFNDGGYGFKA